MSPRPPARADLLAETTGHALAWLVAGNALGLLLATLLLFPRLDALLTPITYGRLMPLHLNLELYGWCALPLVALLLRTYLPIKGTGTISGLLARLAVLGWSATLAFGASSWLAGATTAKPFLDWTGPARGLLLGELVLLALALAAGWWHRRELPRRQRLAGWLSLAALLAVPAALAVATRPETYPPINPATGGPTGASLLGSTLAVVALFLAAPRLLALERMAVPSRSSALQAALPLIFFAAHAAFFLFVRHGDHSHHEGLQIFAVVSLLLWPPLVARCLAAYRWPAGSRRWLWGFAGWGLALFVSAVVTFLPGVLDRLKFTHGLVAHAHLAMAGMASSFLLLVLVVLGQESGLARALASTRGFWLWQGGAIVHVGVMLGLGIFEGRGIGLVTRGGAVVELAFVLRWLAGAAMLAASVEWLAGVLTRRRRHGLAPARTSAPARPAAEEVAA